MSCFKCSKSVAAHDMKYGLHAACFSRWFETDHFAEFENIIPRAVGSNDPGSQDEKFSQVASSFFQGKFKKYSANLGKKSFLLKVQEEGYLELPQTEYLCNQIADMLGILIPKYYLIAFNNQIPTFVCENFMHEEQVANLIHIYHFLDDPKDYNCEALYRIVLEKTQKLSDAERLIEVTLFDALIGNHDRHGRNLGLIQSKKGFRLSPIYDNPSYLGIEQEAFINAQLEPRGRIATQSTDDPTIKDYVLEWKRLGLEKRVVSFYKEIKIEKLLRKIDSSFLRANRKSAFKRLISKRYEEYSNAITER